MKQSFVGKAACRFVKNSPMQTLACTELSGRKVEEDAVPKWLYLGWRPM